MANLTYAYRNDLDGKTGKQTIEADLPTTSQDTSAYYDDFEGVLVKGENGEIYAAFDDHSRNDPINMADVMEIEITEAPNGIQAMTILAQRGAGQHFNLNDQTTAEMEGEQDSDDLLGPIPQGLKYRKNRQRGGCKCPECGDTFINAARLERHLAVHQVFGSYLCPLCGKTYKYEYNLFYHWRRTCRDLNDLLGSTEERRTMDVNALRALVDEVASKKAEIGPIDIGISRSLLFQNGPVAKLEIPKNPLGHRGTACQACGLIVLTSHMERHIRIHRGDLQPDERSTCGGYFCDLCGLMFRQHFNLIKHWRTACPEIQANLPENCELTLDDRQLKEMVKELIQKAATNHVEERDYKLPIIRNPPTSSLGFYKRNEILDHDVGTLADEDHQRYAEEQGLVFADDFVDEDVSGGMPSSSRSGEKEKWSMDSQPVNCPECFRSFANAGRLERHLAGFHASYGAHHCILCGNRFKYDYNLLYHYRHSCPYTRTFIMRDVREQMDAQSLRKMVRNLAQREVKLTPTITTSHRPFCSTKNSMISNDEMVRRQMLGKVNHQPPPIMTVPKNGLTGKNCPICQIVFYGTAIELHMRRAHSISWEDYLAQKERERAYNEFSGAMEEEDDIEEAPPKLEPEIDPSEPTTTEIPQKETLMGESITQPKSTIIHIKKVNGTFVEVTIEGFEEGYLQTLIDSGQLELEPGDQIEFVGEAEETEEPHEGQEVGDIEYEDLPQNDDY